MISFLVGSIELKFLNQLIFKIEFSKQFYCLDCYFQRVKISAYLLFR